MNVDDARIVLGKMEPLAIYLRKTSAYVQSMTAVEGGVAADLTPEQRAAYDAIAGYVHLAQLETFLAAETARLEAAMRAVRNRTVSA
jgi:hypothetical protein